MRRHATPDERIARRAANHHGLITRALALGCGLTDRQIARRVAAGRWVRIAPGVFRIHGAPVTAAQTAYAAVLAAGDGAIVGGLSALALYGLSAAPVLPHITVPRGASARTKVALVRRSDVGSIDRTRVGPVPCATAARALVEAARHADKDLLADLVDSTLHRDLATPSTVLAALRRAGSGPGRAGSPTLRLVLEPWLRGILPGSPGEVRLLRRLDDWGFPTPSLQHQVETSDGCFRLDVAWPERLVGLEYDGERFHDPRHLGSDVAREEALRRRGWWIGRVDRHDLAPSSTRLRDGLRQRLVVPAA
jgi:hypothetical protein